VQRVYKAAETAEKRRFSKNHEKIRHEWRMEHPCADCFFFFTPRSTPAAPAYSYQITMRWKVARVKTGLLRRGIVYPVHNNHHLNGDGSNLIVRWRHRLQRKHAFESTSTGYVSAR